MRSMVEPRRRSERRDRILRAASLIFARRPFGHASMDEIAQEAGVGKPTLYRYFDGKDDLFAAVFAEVLDGVEERLDAVAAAEPDPASRLIALAAAIVPVFRDHLVTGRLVDEGAEADRSKRRVFRERQARIAVRLERAVADGIAAGLFRPVEPGRTARFLVGALWSGAATGEGDDQVVASDVVELLLYGLSAAPPGPGPGGSSPSLREVTA